MSVRIIHRRSNIPDGSAEQHHVVAVKRWRRVHEGEAGVVLLLAHVRATVASSAAGCRFCARTRHTLAGSARQSDSHQFSVLPTARSRRPPY